MMTGRKFLSPPLLWLAPQSDHGSAACAETEAFFQYGPPQSFFTLLARPTKSTSGRTDDRAQISKPPPSYGSLRNPITGVPRARKLMLFSNMARCNPFSSLTQLVAPQKARARGANFSAPPLLWLAPPSDRGSAARALKLKLFSTMARRNLIAGAEG